MEELDNLKEATKPKGNDFEGEPDRDMERDLAPDGWTKERFSGDTYS